MDANTRMSKMGFEIENCSRCGGSGQYSYCQRYGTRCFKCGGKKWTYTAKGQAARNYYESLCKVSGGDLRAGDVIHFQSVTMGGDVYSDIATVTDVSGADVVTDKITFSNGKSSEYRLKIADDKKIEYLAAAVAYQSTLTKKGTPKKEKA